MWCDDYNKVLRRYKMSQQNELFVILDSINKTKSELDLPQESFDKNAFMVNRFLSYHRDALYFSHEMSMPFCPCSWRSQYFWSGFFRLLFLRVDCDCNRPSFLATVFYDASSFNGDLNQWDVAKVTDMSWSKSIRIVENDLTWCEVMLLWLEGLLGVLGLVVM